MLSMFFPVLPTHTLIITTNSICFASSLRYAPTEFISSLIQYYMHVYNKIEGGNLHHWDFLPVFYQLWSELEALNFVIHNVLLPFVLAFQYYQQEAAKLRSQIGNLQNSNRSEPVWYWSSYLLDDIFSTSELRLSINYISGICWVKRLVHWVWRNLRVWKYDLRKE